MFYPNMRSDRYGSSMQKGSTFDQALLNRLFRYAVALVGNEDGAYDLLQSGVQRFLEVQKRQKVDEPAAYLRTIIRNLYIDGKRSAAKMDSIEDMAENGDIISLKEPSPEDVSLTAAELQSILRILTSSERELLFLWAVEGFTAEEIANAFETPRGTILARLHRLKKRIRKQLRRSA